MHLHINYNIRHTDYISISAKTDAGILSMTFPIPTTSMHQYSLWFATLHSSIYIDCGKGNSAYTL